MEKKEIKTVELEAPAAEKKQKVLKIKTYGARGLMEWQLELPTGNALLPYVKAHFEGGQITGYGVAPARFTTDCPMTQKAIEMSPMFKDNRIYLINERDLPGDPA